eukprot:scaffold2557_cov135-Isochrysis_galbana.AAC.3
MPARLGLRSLKGLTCRIHFQVHGGLRKVQTPDGRNAPRSRARDTRLGVSSSTVSPGSTQHMYAPLRCGERRA